MCVFCKIINKEIPSEILYEDDLCIVIKDIEPKAPTHLLLIIKEHKESLNNFINGEELLLGKLLFRLKEIAKEVGINESGYKIVINTGREGGQIVPHLHMHLLGGKSLFLKDIWEKQLV